MASPNTAVWHGYDFKVGTNEPTGYHHTRVDDLHVGPGLEGVIDISPTKEGVTFRYNSSSPRSILSLRVEFVLKDVAREFGFVGEFAVDFSNDYQDGGYHEGIPKTQLNTANIPLQMSAGPNWDGTAYVPIVVTVPDITFTLRTVLNGPEVKDMIDSGRLEYVVCTLYADGALNGEIKAL